MRRTQLAGILLVAAAAFSGCTPAAVNEKTYEAKSPSGLDQAKGILENYAKGAPMTSEGSSFPAIVEEVKKTSPQKADILEKGFADLQKSSKSELAAKAKALLKKL